MELAPLGKLSRDERVEELLESSPVPIPFLGGMPLPVNLWDWESDKNPFEFESAIRHFLALTLADRAHSAQYVFKNYRDFVDIVGEEEFDFTIPDETTVWNHVTPMSISVSRRPHGNRKVYVTVDAECDWEPEHGLQLVFLEGKTLTRVSAQDGRLAYSDAYDVPESEDRIC